MYSHQAGELLKGISDSVHGGFGGAPKFPMEPQLQFLLGQARTDGSADEEPTREKPWGPDHVMLSLRRMADSGVYDHLGGGFFRYAVDDAWGIPHFEKMLYDNGQLLSLYVQAGSFCQDKKTVHALLKRVVEGTANWAMQVMQADNGGYYAALDADDAQGKEGGFYVWRGPDVKKQLPEEQWQVFAPTYSARGMRNFEGDWHLVRDGDRDTSDEENILLQQACASLLEERNKRPALQCDDKVISSWNGLMISGMAQAARMYQRADWLSSAERALDCLRLKHWHDDVLAHQSVGDTIGHAGFLSDYAFCAEAALDVLACRWNSEDMDVCHPVGRNDAVTLC